MKLVINCETGEETYEELTSGDIAQQVIDEAEMQKPKVITDPFEIARLAAYESAQSKLAKLGLTADDLKALGL